jgi:hypothetical protein
LSLSFALLFGGVVGTSMWDAVHRPEARKATKKKPKNNVETTGCILTFDRLLPQQNPYHLI